MSLTIRTLLAALALAATTGLALAHPPPWAPAHGYRDKHEHRHHDHGRDRYPRHHRSVIDLQTGRCDHRVAGAIIGGVVGGVVGNQAGEGHEDRELATIAGTILGAFIGGHLGRSYDRADRYCTGRALERVPNGRTVQWRNPDTGAYYRVTPRRTYHKAGRPCREFVTHAQIGNRQREIYGTACRQADGSWRIVDQGRYRY